MQNVLFQNIKQDIKESPINFLFIGALIGVAVFLPFKISFANTLIGVATFFWLLNIKNHFSSFENRLLKPLFIFTSLYLVLIVGFLYTTNIPNALSILERKLPLIILPVIVLTSSIKKIHVQIIERVFIIATTVAASICYYHVVKTIISFNLPWNSLVSEAQFHNQSFTLPISIHPAYLSLFLCLALVIIFINLKNQPAYIKLGGGFLFLYLLITQLQLMARAGLYGLLITAIILIVYQTLLSRKITILVMASVAIIVCTFLILRFIPEVKLRVVDSMENINQSMYNDDQSSSPGLHVKSWYCAITSWYKGNALFGFGTGDEKDVLKKCYSDNHWNDMVKEEYDSHNEYLSTLVRHGIVGLLLWITCLVYPLYLAFKNFDIVYFTFIILISIAAFSESILRGQTALVFYALFNALYFKNILINK